MTTLDILKAARAKVAQGWTQGESARDAYGKPRAATAQDAVCWCVIGAIDSVVWPNFQPRSEPIAVIRKAIGLESPWMPITSLADWNDAKTRTQAEILAAFDKAIVAEETKQ